MRTAEDFDAFVAIVDAGSISAAARALGVPRATLSRQLARLEARLGVRLLHRSTRSLVPTPAGEALYPRARALVDSALAAVEAVRRLDDVPRGVLRVSSAPNETARLGALSSAYIQAHPDVEVELITTSEHVDLATSQVDVALRGGIVRDPNLMARRLLHSDMIAVASPSYLARRGEPSRASDLGRHTCLRGFVAGARPSTVWPLRDGGKVDVGGPFVTNDLHALMSAATHGLGIALLPRHMTRHALQDGALVPLLEGVVGIDVSLSLVWLEREFLDPKIRAFIDIATEWAASGLLDR